MIDLGRLEKPKSVGQKTVARCPACAEQGGDRSCNHLVIYDDGRFGCVANAGDKAHRSRIIELAGSNEPRPVCKAVFQRLPVRGNPAFPLLEKPTVGELARIQALRGFPLFAGLQLAVNAGHLFCADMPDAGESVRVWLITDSSKRNAQARRMDGRLWSGIEAKAKTLRGSEASWPIGAADIGDRPAVALCEGGPDFLSAYFIAWWHGRHNEVAPVAILGAGQRISAEALTNFKGKDVYLFPHQDAAGAKAQATWAKQLTEAGTRSVRKFDCSPDKDLNDLVARCAQEMGESDDCCN